MTLPTPSGRLVVNSSVGDHERALPRLSIVSARTRYVVASDNSPEGTVMLALLPDATSLEVPVHTT
jgi:hypothetical protein